ncbi:uncharacterized protein isoform X2 [Rhodnius prolixus]|uniref:uncharacterized protein isoform X2 n=1 Tax=Rhodnius prolixus TaxID=13249 RepID=UPI003D18C35E
MAFFLGLLMFVMISTANGDDGICEKTWKSIKTVRQSYIHTWHHTYWGYCGWDRCQKRQLQSRIEYRVKYEEVPHTLKYCCNGYEKVSAEPLACHPSCSPNCILGNCTGPGICTCIEGHKQISSYECEPICDPPCVNAKCIDHNKCDCSENYKKDGTTNHICNPVCDEECQNGQCIRPQECQCFDGYKLSDQNRYYCLPQCENCINGICTRPNICECSDGYTKANETCAPYCSRECIHGQCTQPEKCTCNDGYTSHAEEWNHCVPYCSEPCINSLCSEPGICTCLQNYTKVNGSTCEPVCNTPCKNGECTAPDTCECNAGYKPITEYICEPDCTDECINGNCTEPENCTCYEGYTMNEFDNYVCEPVCDGGCLNGNCTLPNVCTCDKDYIKIKHNVCMPICREDCENNFNECKIYPECVQIGTHYFTKGLHYSTNKIVFSIKDAIMSLNWSCSDIFNTSNVDCTFNNCETCSALPLSCISQINFDNKHIQFICKKHETINDNDEERNETNYFIDHTEENFSYSIILIHPEELHGLKKGKCDVCMCGSNLEMHKQNEALFYFNPCQSHKLNLMPTDKSGYGYLYIVPAVLLIIGAILLSGIIYRIRKHSASYRVRREKYDEQELTIEDELLVNGNNIHEDD